MKKVVKAVAPYIYKRGINFKNKPYEAWKRMGGEVASAHYPPRWLHWLMFRFELPSIWTNDIEARLRFVQPGAIFFDTFPDYTKYEIIPFFWDVWPSNFDKVITWLRKHETKTAIFTSSQAADKVQELFPNMKILAVTEGIDCETYKTGKLLKERKIDFFEYGREIDNAVKYAVHNKVNYVKGKRNGKPILSQEELIDNLADAKIVAAYTKRYTNPLEAGDIDTLTQRFWECMLSRCVMIGHAPKELIELIGYNPVVEVDKENPNEQLMQVLQHIEDYQEMVNKNRDSALFFGNWNYSIQRIMSFLSKNGYKVTTLHP